MTGLIGAGDVPASLVIILRLYFFTNIVILKAVSQDEMFILLQRIGYLLVNNIFG